MVPGSEFAGAGARSRFLTDTQVAVSSTTPACTRETGQAPVGRLAAFAAHGRLSWSIRCVRRLAAGEPDQRAQASRLLGLLMDALGYRA